MVKFSKLVDRRKNGGSDQAWRDDHETHGETDGLSLRKLPKRRKRLEQVAPVRDTVDQQAAVEARKTLYNQATEFLGLVFSSVQADKAFSLEPGFKILEKIVDTRTPIDALFLRAIHDEDSYDLMISPSVNVAIYAIKMAENLGFSKTRQVEIGMVGLLHDIGMAKIPKELIYKDSLTDDEFLIFKDRPSYGYEILKTLDKAYAYLAECALQIHERVDGSGYPRGLQADEIHEYAQIIGLVDIYEALIHSRPQREKILHFYAVKEIIKTGKDKFQPRFLKALLNTFSIFPLNSYVRLNSGAIGQVIRTYPDQPMRPKIKILYDSQSKRVLTERLINLPEHALLYIVDSVSEQELVEISESSYLLTKPGQGHSQSHRDRSAPSVSRDEPAGKTTAVKKRKRPRLAEARAAKPRGNLPKKLLLALAVLFLVAGFGWQVLVDNQESEADQLPAPADTYVSEKVSAVKPVPDTGQSKKAASSAEKAMQLAATTKTAGLETPGVDIKRVDQPAAQPAGTAASRDSLNATAAAKTAAGSDEPTRPVQTAVISKAEKRESNQVEIIGPPKPGQYPYSVLLGSFKQKQTAERSIAEYREKGLNPYWVEVDLGDKGTWFRVFNGQYQDSGEARVAIDQYRLTGALIKKTRYANWVAGFTDETFLDARRGELADKGISTYVIIDNTGTRQLFAGAFLTHKGARDQYNRLQRAGVETRIVER